MKALLRAVFAFTIIASIAACAPSVPQEQYDEAQSQIDALTDQVATHQAYGDEARASLAERDDRIATVEAEAADLRRQLSEERGEAAALALELGTYVCDETLAGMQYDDILTASTLLSAFVASQPWSLRVNGDYRDSIWTNAPSKVHGIGYVDAEDNQEYVTYFMVYFDEFGFEEGVFWIDRQCWLDR